MLLILPSPALFSLSARKYHFSPPGKEHDWLFPSCFFFLLPPSHNKRDVSSSSGAGTHPFFCFILPQCFFPFRRALATKLFLFSRGRDDGAAAFFFHLLFLIAFSFRRDRERDFLLSSRVAGGDGLAFFFGLSAVLFSSWWDRFLRRDSLSVPRRPGPHTRQDRLLFIS